MHMFTGTSSCLAIKNRYNANDRVLLIASIKLKEI